MTLIKSVPGWEETHVAELGPYLSMDEAMHVYGDAEFTFCSDDPPSMRHHGWSWHLERRKEDEWFWVSAPWVVFRPEVAP